MEFQTDIENVQDAPWWLTPREIDQLRKASKQTRNPIRNDLITLMLYRHGLRESELCNIRLDAVNFDTSQIYIKRLKGSVSCMHPIEGDEMRLLKRYLAKRKGKYSLNSPWLFLSEQGNQLHRQTVFKMIERLGNLAQMRHITPHMLRHSCGYYLANKNLPLRVIQDYLGHKNIQNTVIYTKLNDSRFKGIWG